MRTSSYRGCVKEDVWKIITICLLFFLASCAKTTSTGRFKHLPPKKVKIEHERAPETGAKKEIIRTEPAYLAMAQTPKAKASEKMVETGRVQLAQGNFESAQNIFQEAINIDPANGIAYYYLAKAKFELGMFAQANGVLDKAEELLQGSKEWMEAVAKLREMIKTQ